MDGFGTTERVFDDPHVFNNFDNTTRRALTTMTTTQQDDILDKLYRDLKLTRVRTAAAGDNGGLEVTNDNSDPNVTDRSKFTLAWKLLDAHCDYITRAKSRGVTTYFNSPINRESWMGTTTANDAAEYAEWLLVQVQRCSELGVNFPYLAVANEPSYTRNTMSGAFVRDVIKNLGPRLRANGFNTMFVVSDDIRSTDAQGTMNTILSDATARQYVGALAFHLYDEPMSNVSKMRTIAQTYNLPLWMTEFSVNALPTAGLTQSAFGWGDMMHDLISTYSVSAVDYIWGFFGQWQGDNLMLLRLNTNSGGSEPYTGYTIEKAYYVIGQYSKYVWPGDVRVSASSTDSNVKVTAYKNGSVTTIVAINDNSTDQSVQFNLNNLSDGTLQAVRTSTTENWASLPSVTVASGTFTTTLTANSITTFTTPGRTAPTVFVTTPIAGTTVTGTAVVAANGTDDTGIAGIQFKLDGSNLGSEVTSSPYTVSLSSSSTTNGTHALSAVVRDTDGNLVTSPSVSVTVFNDVTGPVVSSMTATSVSQTSATITWTTDEPSDSQVEYGLTTSYGSSTTLDSTLTTSHSVSLTGLIAGTTYNFRVKSSDTYANLTTSSNATFTTTSTPAVFPGYTYRRLIDITDAQVSSGPHTNFPVLISTTLASLKTTGNAGNVTDLQGDDIIFTDSDGVTQLAHEVEKYDPTTGQLIAWVRVPSLAATSTLFMYYGNSAVTTFQGNVTSNGATGVWDPSFKAVYHFPNGTTLTAADSTSNANNGTLVNGPTATTGIIGGGANLVETSTQYISVGDPANGSLDFGTGSFTMSGWYKGTDTGGGDLVNKNTSLGAVGYDLLIAGTTARIFDGSTTISSSMATGVADNAWHYVVGVVNRTGQVIQIYTDGIQRGSNVSTAAVGTVSNSVSFSIGSRNSGASNLLTGAIDEIHMANVVRSLGWITTEYNNQNSPSGFYTIGSETFADSTSPSVSVTAPADAATVSGASVSVTATASDDVGVSGVQFKLDGSNLGAEDTSSPYAVIWDTTSATEGSHTLTAVARDAASNSTTSSTVTVTVDNTAPVRSAGSPSSSLSVNTTSTSISLTTNENATCKYSTSSGTTYGSMSVFGTTGGTSHSSPVSGLTNGSSYSYYVKCSDGQANTNATDYTISFSVAADSTSPSVSVTAPADAATVSGASVSVTATASDDVGVSGVQFKLDGSNLGAEDTSSPYAVIWDTTSATEGSHTLTAVARDAASNSTTSSTVTVTVDNTAPGITNVASIPSDTTATITWNTDENASSTVEYGLTDAYSNTTAETDTPIRVQSHSVSISDLVACSTYYYRVASRDSSLNRIVGTGASFTTSGCIASSPVSSQNSVSATEDDGATADLLVDSKGISLDIPPAFSSSDAEFQIKKLDSTTVLSAILPPATYEPAGDYIFELKALQDVSTPITSFDNPITVSIAYGASDIVGLQESTLKIYRYDGSTWYQLSNCSVDTAAKVVTCSTSNFSVFGLFGLSAPDTGGSAVVGSRRRGHTDILADAFQPSSTQIPATGYKASGNVTVKYIFGAAVLRLHSRSEGVKELQRFLNASLNLHLSVDGIMGPKTVAGVKLWQKMNGLIADGIVGPKTKAKISQSAVQ